MNTLPELQSPVEGSAFNTVEITDQHELRGMALAVPGAYWHRERKHYVVDNPTARSARAVMRMFPKTVIEYPELVSVAEQDYGKADARPHDYPNDLKIEIDVGEFADGKVLYDWQDIDAGYLAAIMERDEGAFVGWEPGLGKTICAAAFMRKFDWRRTIVICRNDAKESVWANQLRDLLPEYELRIIPNPKGKRDRMLAEIASWPAYAKPLVFIIHYEALGVIADGGGGKNSQGGKGKGWDALGTWDACIFDEGHKLASSNPNSPGKNPQRWKALHYLRKQHVKHAINLTGSGIMNHEEDLFGQLNFILPNTYKAKWADWNDRYLDFVKVGDKRICIGFQADKLPQLRKELGVFTVYRTKREVFPDMPEPIITDLKLDLHPEQRKVYEQLADEHWAMVENNGIRAVNPISLLTKLRQVATYWPGVPSIKLDTAIAEMEDLHDQQFVVFTWFKEPGRALVDRYGEDCVVVDGDVPIRHRADLLRQHAEGRARILVGSIATLGESLNLQYCNEAIRLDRDWNPETNRQTVRRLDRKGQENLVTMRDLWANDTVDMLNVFPTIVGKESLRRAIYG